MNQRLLTVFGFAIVVAGLASFTVYRLIVTQVHAPAAPVQTSRVVVASHDLAVGALIQEADVREVNWSDLKPDHTFGKAKDVVGRGAITTIFRNELLLEPRLAQPGAGAGLAATIPMGMRAVALRVNEVVGLAGFVLPGMRVDVLIAGTAPQGAGAQGTLSRTILQNIEVLSAGQRIEKTVDGKPESAQVVNLLVTPDQAETLSLASNETKVQLVLRNPLDTKEAATKGSSVATLFGGVAPDLRRVAYTAPVRSGSRPRPTQTPAAAPAAPKQTSIEIFNGTKRSEKPIQELH